MNIQIRPATIEDIDEVHAMVRELAIFEKAESSVKTSPEIYKKDFKDGIFEVKVAVLNQEIVGMVLYFMAYSTWRGKMMYLDDFVVKNKYRNRGIGQLLFDAFIQESKAQGATMVKWQVLDWNEHAIRFYEKNKAEIEKNWWNVKIIF